MEQAEAAERSEPRAWERYALLIGFGIGSLAWNVCWPFLSLRVQAVGVSDLGEVARLTGLLAVPANMLSAALGPFWSALGERFGYRLQIIRAHLGTSISMVVTGLARTPLELAGATTLLGALGGNYPHYMALAASRSAPSEVGRVVGDMQAAGQIGGTIGPLIGGLIAGQYGLTPAFVVSGVISAGGALMVAALVRDRPVAGEVHTRPRGSLKAAFAQPEQRRLMVLFLLGETSAQGLRPLIPIVMTERLEDAAAVATVSGLAATLVTAATVVAALAIGRLSRRIEPRLMLITLLPLGAILAAAIPLAPGVVAPIALWTALSLASGAVAPAVFAWLGRMEGGAGGYALLASTSMLGYALGPVVMGQASVHGLDWPFRLSAAMMLLTAISIAIVGRSPKEVARA
jgi:DHA1 family multidrug resistance protein-like MFS transporter